MTPPESKPRKSGVREQEITGLAEQLVQLKKSVIQRYSAMFKYTQTLKTSSWMYPGNEWAIREKENVLGETNDTLYLKSQPFILNADDLIVVLGVNHNMTGKTLYSNVNCYGTPAFNGLGGIISTQIPPKGYLHTAATYLPDLSQEEQDRLYVYKFARPESPWAQEDTTYTIQQNQDNTYDGINNGILAFMGFRLYIDRTTTIGPYPGETLSKNFFGFEGPPDSEVFFDQAILFTNHSPLEKN